MRAVLTILVAASLPLLAQRGPGEMGPHPGGFGFGHQQVVTNAPFTANITNTRLQQLPGGNTIQQSFTGFMARDDAGRTYQKQTVSGGALAPGTQKTMIFITDPVAGYSYVLNESNLTGTRRPLHNPNSANGARLWTGPHNLQGDNPADPRAALKGTATDLGQDSSSGVLANGKSLSHTIPAGQIGNTADIVSTNQVWYSPDLKLVVKSVRNDPRFGQSTYALTGIVRGTPDESLFQIPSSYKIVDAPTHGFKNSAR